MDKIFLGLYFLGVVVFISFSFMTIKQLFKYKLPEEKVDTPVYIFCFLAALIVMVSLMYIFGLN